MAKSLVNKEEILKDMNKKNKQLINYNLPDKIDEDFNYDNISLRENIFDSPPDKIIGNERIKNLAQDYNETSIENLDIDYEKNSKLKHKNSIELNKMN